MAAIPSARLILPRPSDREILASVKAWLKYQGFDRTYLLLEVEASGIKQPSSPSKDICNNHGPSGTTKDISLEVHIALQSSVEEPASSQGTETPGGQRNEQVGRCQLQSLHSQGTSKATSSTSGASTCSSTSASESDSRNGNTANQQEAKAYPQKGVMAQEDSVNGSSRIVEGQESREAPKQRRAAGAEVHARAIEAKLPEVGSALAKSGGTKQMNDADIATSNIKAGNIKGNRGRHLGSRPRIPTLKGAPQGRADQVTSRRNIGPKAPAVRLPICQQLCRYEFWGRCSKGSQCPWSHDLNLRTASSFNPKEYKRPRGNEKLFQEADRAAGRPGDTSNWSGWASNPSALWTTKQKRFMVMASKTWEDDVCSTKGSTRNTSWREVSSQTVSTENAMSKQRRKSVDCSPKRKRGYSDADREDDLRRNRYHEYDRVRKRMKEDLHRLATRLKH